MSIPAQYIKPLLTVALLWCSLCCKAQVQVLGAYDFDKGGYYLLGQKAESDFNELAERMGEWYTDDTDVLNAFKKAWTFDKKSPMYACGYHYVVYLCRKGKVLDQYYINLNCHEFATETAQYYFDTEKLQQFAGKLKKPYVQQIRFQEIYSARTYLRQIASDSTLIYVPHPRWEAFEGEFQFSYLCKDSTKDCYEEENHLLAQIEDSIRKTYPNERFRLEPVGGSSREVDVRITCNQSLSDSFTLFHRDLDIYKWEPFELQLKSYWSKAPVEASSLVVVSPHSKQPWSKGRMVVLVGGVLVIVLGGMIALIRGRKARR